MYSFGLAPVFSFFPPLFFVLSPFSPFSSSRALPFVKLLSSFFHFTPFFRPMQKTHDMKKNENKKQKKTKISAPLTNDRRLSLLPFSSREKKRRGDDRAVNGRSVALPSAFRVFPVVLFFSSQIPLSSYAENPRNKKRKNKRKKKEKKQKEKKTEISAQFSIDRRLSWPPFSFREKKERREEDREVNS